VSRANLAWITSFAVRPALSRASWLACALCLPLAACVAPEPDDLDGDGDTDAAAGEVGPREAWSPQDTPHRLDDDFNYEFDELPTRGRAKRLPWPGSYWPSYLDGINYRWAGPNTRSPAEKYGLAFGKKGVEDAVSRHSGVDSLPTPACRKTSDCRQGEACARRRGESRGRCTAPWVGICHAWAPAALFEREPQRPVTYRGVRFEINDLKALITMAYTEGLSARLVSLRCDEDGDGADLHHLSACRDTNPGTFHVVLANLLGLRRTAFIHDRVYDDEVWNFPVIAYRVARNDRISAAAANRLLGASGNRYRFNDRAAELRRIRTEVSWVSAAPSELDGALLPHIDQFTTTDIYEYILEIDGRGDIIGGEWLGGSRTLHPDFLWIPVRKRPVTVAGKIEYDDVERLMKLAGGGR
jgi:hypothetical protein